MPYIGKPLVWLEIHQLKNPLPDVEINKVLYLLEEKMHDRLKIETDCDTIEFIEQRDVLLSFRK